ncbi:hypothetical protein GGH94_001302 [Coemansia aciculifera]|uniref:Uncharacterized protein n=1 Tax=Coemansia aciculifera TaxID=417176 RepID=A0A9W8M8B0_9FUNG|nr:hypothetical protein GGH94_001302 [Coemansia aciculifera]
MPDKRRRKNPPNPQLPGAEPVVNQIETGNVTNAAVPAVDSQEAPVVPAARPVRAPSRLLRRTQSEAAPTGDKKPDDSRTWSLTSLDSGSESDLPEASSLLRTPVLPKRTAQSRSKSKGGNKKRKRQRVQQLVKSASEIPRTTADGDPDSSSECTSLRVPGELIMAYYLRKYYPARIESQPKHDRYAIEFFDGKRATMIRKRFYTQYEPQFSTCAMGEMRLIGDEPAKSFTKESDVDIDPERDFERECKLYPRLVAEMEKIRHHLAVLHSCSADEVAEIAATEDRMAVFFGDDSTAKRQLSYRVYPAFLNRGEFDFAGRILWRWFAAPPSATRRKTIDHNCMPTSGNLDSGEPKQHIVADGEARGNCSIDGTDLHGAESSHPSEPIRSSATPESAALDDMTELGASTLAINFIHDVLLPHAIKRMIVEREGCSLDDAEERMQRVNEEINWVDQILAARKTNAR